MGNYCISDKKDPANGRPHLDNDAELPQRDQRVPPTKPWEEAKLTAEEEAEARDYIHLGPVVLKLCFLIRRLKRARGIPNYSLADAVRALH